MSPDLVVVVAKKRDLMNRSSSSNGARFLDPLKLKLLVMEQLLHKLQPRRKVKGEEIALKSSSAGDAKTAADELRNSKSRPARRGEEGVVVVGVRSMSM
uniref:Uncharacterized protein n=1 Tax=Leersia perrieri TaxID=77586 RepID=A0A0D9WC59_9ORYZ